MHLQRLKLLRSAEPTGHTDKAPLQAQLTACCLVVLIASTPRRYFPAMYYLASSKLNKAVLCNFALASTLTTCKLAIKVRPCTPAPPRHQSSYIHRFHASPDAAAARAVRSASHNLLPLQVFLGRLRESENERVVERMWHGMMEIVISWSMFGQAVDASFLVYMVALGCLKALHWLVQDRINFMQTEPHISRVQHARTVSCLAVLMVRSPPCPCSRSHARARPPRGDVTAVATVRRLSMWRRCAAT